MKTKEYAQLVESRNKKKLADAPRRTLSDTRAPADASKTQKVKFNLLKKIVFILTIRIQ